jgi:hypothetical protein
MPERLRIQRRRTKGWRLPAATICVTRGSKWGNPFRTAPGFDADGIHVPEMTAELSVHCYADYLDRALANWPSVRESVREIAGYHLACWCHLCSRHQNGKPFAEACADCAPCHADILGQRAQALTCEAIDA